MDVSLQLSARWRKFWRPSSATTSTAAADQQARSKSILREKSSDTTPFHKLDSSMSVSDKDIDTIRVDPAVNARLSPLLRLPAELRNEIFSYVDYSDYIIQVLSLSKDEYNALDANGAPLVHNPYPNNSLWYRIEEAADREFSLDNPNIDTRRKRCNSVLGLFALPRVCHQIRAETMFLHFSGPSFAFSDKRFNYPKAFPAFVRSLRPHERAAIRSIHWPLRQAREFYHRSQVGEPMEKSDQACAENLLKLPNLASVTLQYLATDVGGLRLTGGDLQELERMLEGVSEGVRYVVERAFRRELAVRGMHWQISFKDGVAIQCEKRSVDF